MTPESQILVRELTLAPIAATVAPRNFSAAAIAKAAETQAVKESEAAPIPLDYTRPDSIGEIEPDESPADQPEEPTSTQTDFWDKQWLNLSVKTWAWISGGVLLLILLLIIVFTSLKNKK